MGNVTIRRCAIYTRKSSLLGPKALAVPRSRCCTEPRCSLHNQCRYQCGERFTGSKIPSRSASLRRKELDSASARSGRAISSTDLHEIRLHTRRGAELRTTHRDGHIQRHRI